MERKFFVKAGRHAKEDKKLLAEIYALIDNAEKSNNKKLLDAASNHPLVNTSDGLRSMLETLKAHQSGSNNIGVASNNVSSNNDKPEVKIIKDNFNNDNNMKTENNKNSDSAPKHHEEESVPFEDVIDVGKDFQQPVIERNDEEFTKYQTGESKQDDANPADGNNVEDGEQVEEPKDNGDDGSYDAPPESPDGNLADIPSDTKRKAIKKTSEIVAKIYAGVLPMLPKFIAKVPEAKIERLVWADEIDPKMKLDLGEGHVTTVAGYIEGYNASLDEQLVITEEQQKEFQEALKDVLEEKQVAMTPSQRLVTVVVAQTFTLMAMGIQNSIMMRKHLEHWKEIHQERKGGAPAKKNPPPSSSQMPPPPPPPPAPSPSPNGNGGGNPMKDYIQEESDEISITPETVQEK